MKIKATDIGAVRNADTGKWHWTVPSAGRPGRTKSVRGRETKRAALAAGLREYRLDDRDEAALGRLEMAHG